MPSSHYSGLWQNIPRCLPQIQMGLAGHLRANAALIDIDNADVNVDRQRGGRRLDDVKNKSSVILFAEDHSAGNALRYGASTKCWNRGYTYEYSRQNGTLENDDAKIGYHDYKNNYAILDGSVLLLNWEETLKPINRWIVK